MKITFVTNWYNMLVIFIIFGALLSLMSLILFAFYDEFKIWIIAQIGKIKATIHKLHKKYGILWTIYKKLHGNELSYLVDVIFQLFCKFYEVNKNDIIHWGFDVKQFPNGSKDLSDLYYWITKTRIDNYEKVKHLIYANDHIEYWGSIYNSFKFYINKNGELIIVPKNVNQKFLYEHERMILKMQNALYNLDTKKLIWIIERRKYFGF